MEDIFLKILSAYHIGFFVFHIFFWKLFSWKKESKRMSLANSAILQITNIQLMVYFLFLGTLLALFDFENLQTTMGMLILGFSTLFWLVRFICQFIFLRVASQMVYVLNGVFAIGFLLHVFLLIQVV
jgi:hypothetical protein